MIWIGLAGTGTVARSLWMQAEAPNHIVVADPNGDVLAFPGGYITGGGMRTADGRIITDEEPWTRPGRRAGPGCLVTSHLTRSTRAFPATSSRPGTPRRPPGTRSSACWVSGRHSWWCAGGAPMSDAWVLRDRQRFQPDFQRLGQDLSGARIVEIERNGLAAA